jgi:hypothetical protein
MHSGRVAAALFQMAKGLCSSGAVLAMGVKRG